MTTPPKERIYHALIGDIVGSSTLSNRAEVQRALEGLVETLNEELGEPENGGLATAIRLTAGDEIQALLVDSGHTVDVVVRIADELHPTLVAWGLGVGPITTELGPDVARIDGPCFHRAREAVGEAGAGDEWLRAKGFPAPHGQTISALFRLMGAIRSRWKPAQIRYIRGARRHLQRKVAELNNVDESTVSKALQAARFRDVEDAEAAVRDLLRWVAVSMNEPEGGET